MRASRNSMRSTDQNSNSPKAILGTLLVVLSACAPSVLVKPAGPAGLEHLVVIYLENHSFDNLYGEFPAANGIANAGSHATQVDRAGNAFATLPTPPGGAFPSNLANTPFSIEQYIP